MSSSELDGFKATYFTECSELLADTEENLSALEQGEEDVELLHAVFRAVHSIKGGAGAFGFAELVAFTHSFESLLDLMRDHKVDATPEVVELCIRGLDVVADLVAAAREGNPLDAAHGAEVKVRIEQLVGGNDNSLPVIESFDDLDFTPVRVDMVDADDGFASLESLLDAARAPVPAPVAAPVAAPPAGMATGLKRWKVSFKPHRALFERANDPLWLLLELAGLGNMTSEVSVEPAEPLQTFDPMKPLISWMITLETAAGRDEIESVFEFVDGDCDLAISLQTDAAQATSDNGPNFADLLGSVLGPAAVIQAPPAAAPAPVVPEPASIADAISSTDPMPSMADLLAELCPAKPSPEQPSTDQPSPALQSSATVAPAVPAPAARPEASKAEAVKADSPKSDSLKSDAQTSIRVDLDKVDRVVDMVGELVITQSMLTQAIDDHLRERYPDVVRGLEILAQHTRSLQDSVMSIRAQPVKSVFARMPRLVRELAGTLGKKVRLEMQGEMTEIDKTVIEQLADPLTHMIRNSLDHGIEMPEKRRALGKPEEGVIRLSAEQVGGRIVIQVSDDGAGINRERVMAKAIERGIVLAGAAMDDEEIDELIFAPGFSTAESVTSVSGRGVGMDVVRKNMAKLSGRVSVRNTPGRGACMTLALPLTLAVMDVMMVRVGDTPFVVPLSSIVETMQTGAVSLGQLPGGAQVLRARGEYVPLMGLSQLFTIEERPSEEGTFIILCESDSNSRVAIVVDAIYGQQQVVIKSIEANFERLEGIAGATILGDGRVALILDIPGLKRVAERKAPIRLAS